MVDFLNGQFRGLFAGVLAPMYADAQLINYTTSRDPVTLSNRKIAGDPISIKVQRETCTKAQRSQTGYSSEDVRFLVLQHGISTAPNDDSRISFGGVLYLVQHVDADPAGIYWDIRARSNGPAT